MTTAQTPLGEVGSLKAASELICELHPRKNGGVLLCGAMHG